MNSEQIKIGVLYPLSVQYKTIGTDFLKGLKLLQLPVKFMIESIGIGNDDKLAIDKMQKMHLQDDVQVFVAFTGHNNIANIYSYARSNNLILIVNDLGATLPFAIEKQEGVFINSYALNESVYLLGKLLKQKGYTNICTSTSYYDAGYGLLIALESGIAETGLQFSGHYITPFNPRENESECMEHTIKATEPDAVVAFHSGLYAQEHKAFIANTGLLNTYPYYVTPFTLSEGFFDANSPELVFVAASWMPGSHAGKEFCAEYEAKYNEKPTVFSMLGYESGLFLNEIVNNSNGTFAGICEAISTCKLNGPRGAMSIDAETNRTFFNHYIFKTIAYDENNFSFEEVETLENEGEFLKRVLKQPAPIKLGGWHNAYLCH
jgi:ABC-type branched-subunit amino acid transport system substrate-binding protein